MHETTTMLLWGFAILTAISVLASMIRGRREFLVGLLRSHVEKKILPPPSAVENDKKSELPKST